MKPSSRQYSVLNTKSLSSLRLLRYPPSLKPRAGKATCARAPGSSNRGVAPGIISSRSDKVFDKADTAKLKDGKALNEAGDYLQSNPFGLAVVAAYTDMKGDTDKARLLTEARAMVVRDYLVKHFKLEDTRIKTIGWENAKKRAKVESKS